MGVTPLFTVKYLPEKFCRPLCMLQACGYSFRNVFLLLVCVYICFVVIYFAVQKKCFFVKRGFMFEEEHLVIIFFIIFHFLLI